MQYKTHQSFTNLLHQTAELRSFVTKIEQLEQINQIVTSKLDPSLSEHCQVANLRDGILILATTSPAWNHKLRFSSLDLLSSLRSDPRWSGLKSIEIRVDYLPLLDKNDLRRPRTSRHISAASALAIKQSADNIACNKLAAALQKLVKHQRPSTDADTQ